MLQSGALWRDCPSEYGPCTTVYNRFHRWAKRGRWQAIFEALTTCGKNRVTLSIDSTSIKAHRSASDGKGGAYAGDLPLTRRVHHKNPRAEQSCLVEYARGAFRAGTSAFP